MLAKHWQHWQSVGKFADVLPTLPTDGQHWPDLACLLGKDGNTRGEINGVTLHNV